jgi:hypothetical protein
MDHRGSDTAHLRSQRWRPAKALALAAAVTIAALWAPTAPSASGQSAANPVDVYGLSGPATSTSQVPASLGGYALLGRVGDAVLVRAPHDFYRLYRMTTAGALVHVAGNGSSEPSGDGGPARSAALGLVRVAVAAPDGTVYLAAGSVVRRIDPATGIISRYAGGGTGGDGGQASDAALDTVEALAVNGAGDLFIGTNRSIRRVRASTGVITTRLGLPPGQPSTGVCGRFADGPGAEYQTLRGMAVRASGVVAALGCGSTGDALVFDDNQSSPEISLLEGSASRARLVPGGEGATAIVMGTASACLVMADTGVRCVGQGSKVSDQASPVEVSDSEDLTGVVEVVQMANNSVCARRSDGTVWCWGNNTSGQLGNGSTTASPNRAVQVSGLTNVTDIAGYFSTACARRSDGTVWCWGSNAEGALGTGSTSPAASSVPVQVTGISVAQPASSLSDGQPCALMTDGTVRCWGANTVGRLGPAGVVSPPDPPLTQSATPLTIAGLTNATELHVASYGMSCAKRSDATVWCWGYSTGGTTVSSPTSLGLSSVGAVAVAYGAVCVVVSGGVRCMGANDAGQLGNGTRVESALPLEVIGGDDAVGIAASAYGFCSRTTGGRVECWGSGHDGQIGDDSESDALEPAEVRGLNVNGAPVTVTALSGPATTTTVCAIDSAQRTWCWGGFMRRSIQRPQPLTAGGIVFFDGSVLKRRLDSGEIVDFAGARSNVCSRDAGTPVSQLCVGTALVRPDGVMILGSPPGHTIGGTFTLLSTGAGEPGGDGATATGFVPATEVVGMTARPDGTVLFANRRGVLREVKGGTLRTVAGNGVGGSSITPGALLSATIEPGALRSTTRGGISFVQYGGDHILRISGGQVVLVAGNGGPDAPVPSGVPATSVPLSIEDVVANDDGSMFIAATRFESCGSPENPLMCSSGSTVHRVSTSGVLTAITSITTQNHSVSSIARTVTGELLVVVGTPDGDLLNRMNTRTGALTSIPLPAALRGRSRLVVAGDGDGSIVVATPSGQVDPSIHRRSPTGRWSALAVGRGADALAIDSRGNLYASSRYAVQKYPLAVHGVATRPAAPRALRAKVVKTRPKRPGVVALSWQAPTGDGYRPITDYVVQVSTNGGTSWKTVKDGVSTKRSTKVTGLTKGRRYTFRVAAKNAPGRSAFTAKVTVKPR